MTEPHAFDLAAWQADVQSYLDRLNERERRQHKPDYVEISEFLPPAHLELLAVLEEKLGRPLPDGFKQFHTQVGAVEWSRVYNGYWIVPLDITLRAIERFDLPTLLKNGTEIPILVFGSDGAGQMFALYLDEAHYGSVYYLPHGINEGGTYERDPDFPPLRLATSFFGFLQRLRDDLVAEVEGNENWKFMDDDLYELNRKEDE